MTTDAKGNVLVNVEKVEEIVNWLVEKGLESYLTEHEDVQQADVFMAVHNFHKYIVLSIAMQWESQVPVNQTLRMADMTFRKAMRELRRLT